MRILPRWIKFTDKASQKTILNPVEQRIYGLIHILQGLTMVIMGKNAPSMILPWISDKAFKKHNARIVEKEIR